MAKSLRSMLLGVPQNFFSLYFAPFLPSFACIMGFDAR
jgi:hypothetical protein